MIGWTATPLYIFSFSLLHTLSISPLSVSVFLFVSPSNSLSLSVSLFLSLFLSLPSFSLYLYLSLSLSLCLTHIHMHRTVYYPMHPFRYTSATTICLLTNCLGFSSNTSDVLWMQQLSILFMCACLRGFKQSSYMIVYTSYTHYYCISTSWPWRRLKMVPRSDLN